MLVEGASIPDGGLTCSTMTPILCELFEAQLDSQLKRMNTLIFLARNRILAEQVPIQYLCNFIMRASAGEK